MSHVHDGETGLRQGRQRPARLTSPGDEASRLLTQQEGEKLFERLVQVARGTGKVALLIEGTWRTWFRWANNQVMSVGDQRSPAITVVRYVGGARGVATTNRTDDYGLALAMAQAAEEANYRDADHDPNHVAALHPTPAYSHPQLFSETTYNVDPALLEAAVEQVTSRAAAAGIRSAGYLEVSAVSRAVLNDAGLNAYAPMTQVQCTVTMRSPDRSGSGWAGRDQNDWAKLDVAGLAQRALEKCRQSVDPKAVEPGRYTVILEPQAVHELLRYAVFLTRDRAHVLGGDGIFRLGMTDPQLYARRDEFDGYGRSGEVLISNNIKGPGALTNDLGKPDYYTRLLNWQSLVFHQFGEQLLDRRLSITSDPMDPECGFLPFDRDGEAYRSTRWITDGILTAMGYDRQYAVQYMHLTDPLPFPGAYHATASGSATSLAEMIETTERGLLVTRFYGVQNLFGIDPILSGVTRDGLWLIERGKISTPVKNLRFAEPPLAAFNRIEQIGVPERVYDPMYPAVVPPVKIRDFNMVALADAV